MVTYSGISSGTSSGNPLCLSLMLYSHRQLAEYVHVVSQLTWQLILTIPHIHRRATVQQYVNYTLYTHAHTDANTHTCTHAHSAFVQLSNEQFTSFGQLHFTSI